MGEAEPKSKGRRPKRSAQRQKLGRKREVALSLPRCAVRDEPEPQPDITAWRRRSKPAARGHGCDPGASSPSSSCGQSEDNRAAEGDCRPFRSTGHHNRACQPSGRICAYVQYCGRLRRMGVPCLSTLFTMVLPCWSRSGRRGYRIRNWICARVILMGLV